MSELQKMPVDVFPFADETDREEDSDNILSMVVCDKTFYLTLAVSETNTARKTLFATHLWQVLNRLFKDRDVFPSFYLLTV